MYASGLLGQMNMMAAGLGNWVRAGAMALGLSMLSGCGGESDTMGDSGIPPIDQPDPDDTTPPNTPQVNLDACLPADTSGTRFRVLVEGTGVRLGTNAPINGAFRMVMPSGALTVLSGATEGRIPFRGRLKWDSVPSEWATVDPDDPIGPLALYTQARLDGQPLTHANMTRAGLTGPWANQFPGFADANRVGFAWPVEGVLHYVRGSDGQVTDCVVDMTIRSAARTSSGMGPALDYGVLPFYAPRSDGGTAAAESNFSNETVVVLDDYIEAILPVSGEAQEICSGDCTDINGASNPSSVRMTLVPNEP